MSQMVTTRPEQLFVVTRSHTTQLWAFSGKQLKKIPWARLGDSTHLYVHDVEALNGLLHDAVTQGFQITEGYHSERRGLRGFTVGIGAHGWRGRVAVRTLDCWALDEPMPQHDHELLEQTDRLQASLRELCRLLNREPTPFRPSGFRWLGSLYDRLGAPQEPDGCAEPLPRSVAVMARAAHVAGPIVHARSRCEPFVSIDRTRAYGNAMCQPMPVGTPARVPLAKGASGSRARWTTWDLMRAIGLAEATIHVKPGPLIPLVPLMRTGGRFDQATILYPVGTFRGVFCLHELAELEQSGRGYVEHFHQVVTFQAAPVLAPIVHYLRELEAQLPSPLKTKRLEHVLYGRCARTLSMSCLGSGPSYRPIIGRDLLTDRTARRVEGSPEIRQLPIRGLKGSSGTAVHHPVYRARAQLLPEAEWGTMDRPDRSAWITATNRIEIARIIQSLDDAWKPERSGSFVGRIYVDGIDLEGTPEQLPDLGEDVTVRRHGQRVDLFRSASSAALLEDGTLEYEAAGLYRRGEFEGSVQQFVAELRSSADASGGPFAGGRIWPPRGEGDDPRFYPGVVSEPPELSPSSAEAMGFQAPA